MMPNLMPCPMPTCGAPIDAVHLVPQGMGAFTYVIRCDCGLSFDTGAQSEAAAADRWNERPALAGAGRLVEDASEESSVADRLDQMADDRFEPGSLEQSDLYAAATVWRRHLRQSRPAPAGVAELDDLAALVRKLVQALEKICPGNYLGHKALDYLKRKGLQGSPLRSEQQS